MLKARKPKAGIVQSERIVLSQTGLVQQTIVNFRANAMEKHVTHGKDKGVRENNGNFEHTKKEYQS